MSADLDRWRSRSFWLETSGDDLSPRPALASNLTADVAIVGGGLTGLWAAHYLRERAPNCRIVVLEAEVCGFGASGRNGGWCSALFPASLSALSELAGRDAAIAQYRAMADTVDEVGRVANRLGIDTEYHKGGTVTVATHPAHLKRLRSELEEYQSFGFGSDDLAWLSPDQMADQVTTSTNLGGLFTPHCAAVQPARLVRGLARAVSDAGVSIFEQSRVKELAEGVVRCEGGTVRAPVVLRCTEGWTPTFAGHRRDVVPLYSLMIATEPLSESVWSAIGLQDRQTFSDGRHLLIYGQRTADGRLAFGGRGAPYHFGSRIDDRFDRNERVHSALVEALHQLFPATRDARITHRWGGPLAVPRDWCASVEWDRSSGIGAAGGYVGDGLSTTNLAGRTLADLVLGSDTDLTRLPWVGHASRRWEPEPLRWLGVNGGAVAAGAADRSESRNGKSSAGWGRLVDAFINGH